MHQKCPAQVDLQDTEKKEQIITNENQITDIRAIKHINHPDTFPDFIYIFGKLKDIKVKQPVHSIIIRVPEKFWVFNRHFSKYWSSQFIIQGDSIKENVIHFQLH